MLPVHEKKEAMMARTFTARYPGRCLECDDDIEAGQEVMYDSADRVIHVECEPDVRPTAKICPTCNLQEPCEHTEAPAPQISPAASAARLAKFTGGARPAPAPATMGIAEFFGQQPDANRAATDFFATPTPIRMVTLEEEIEAKVPRDRWDRPLILQADGSRKPYNRASSYGGQIEDNSNISRWQQQQVVRGIAMHPELLQNVPAVAKGDPWAELDKNTKTGLTRIAEQAQEYAGSNLKSALGTQIHAATEYIDLGDSLEDKLAEFDAIRRKLLIERANAYYRVIQDYGFRWEEIETFGVQDDLMVAGTMDRLGFVPFWPEHKNTVVDNKTSSSLDFAGVGFSVQLATYSRMKRYDIASETRSELEDVNPDKALIIHIGREMGSPVTLAEVDLVWGWQKATLARQILVARREGKGRVREIDERRLLLDSATDRDGLRELGGQIATWPSHLRDYANERWTLLR